MVATLFVRVPETGEGIGVGAAVAAIGVGIGAGAGESAGVKVAVGIDSISIDLVWDLILLSRSTHTLLQLGKSRGSKSSGL